VFFFVLRLIVEEGRQCGGLIVEVVSSFFFFFFFSFCVFQVVAGALSVLLEVVVLFRGEDFFLLEGSW